jgi:hypothetical protein
MRLLPLQIGVGNQGARFAQSEPPLPEQTLALAYPQMDLEALLDPGAQRFSIPQRAGQTPIARRLPQGSVHLPQLRLAQTPGTPRAMPLRQPGQSSVLKAPHPVLHRAWSIPEQPTDLWTGRSLGHQQHPMEPVIIARFFRTANLVLQSQNYCFGISNLQWSHAYMKPQTFNMRNYL